VLLLQQESVGHTAQELLLLLLGAPAAAEACLSAVLPLWLVLLLLTLAELHLLLLLLLFPLISHLSRYCAVPAAAGPAGAAAAAVPACISPVEALCWCASHNGCNGAPLRGHELGQVQQLLILLSRPLSLLDAGVQPLIPTHQHSECRVYIMLV